jgi:ketosteroid isomerase-like protein
MEPRTDQNPRAIVERLKCAINAHDVEGVVACFAEDVESNQPVHPARSFRGREQLRNNWRQILGGVSDLRADLLSCAVDGQSAWTEWAWCGTRADGSAFDMRGVTVQGVRDGAIATVRFFMEPIDTSGADVAAAVRNVVSGR